MQSCSIGMLPGTILPPSDHQAHIHRERQFRVTTSQSSSSDSKTRTIVFERDVAFEAAQGRQGRYTVLSPAGIRILQESVRQTSDRSTSFLMPLEPFYH